MILWPSRVSAAVSITPRGEPGEHVGLLGKLPGVGLLQPPEVVKLPAEAGYLVQVLESRQRPFGQIGGQRTLKPALVSIQATLQLMQHSFVCGELCHPSRGIESATDVCAEQQGCLNLSFDDVIVQVKASLLAAA
jgi:hypothetical protein